MAMHFYYFYKRIFFPDILQTAAMNKSIRQGITFQGKWNFTSFIFVVAGLALCFYFHLWFAGAGIVVLFLPVFLAVRGTDIDFSEKTLRKWISWYGIRFGKNISFSGYSYVKLRNYYSCHTMGCRSVNGTYTARTFEILFGGPDLPGIIIVEIPKYEAARKISEDISDKSGLQLIDSFQDIILKNKHMVQNNRDLLR